MKIQLNQIASQSILVYVLYSFLITLFSCSSLYDDGNNPYTVVRDSIVIEQETEAFPDSKFYYPFINSEKKELRMINDSIESFFNNEDYEVGYNFPDGFLSYHFEVYTASTDFISIFIEYANCGGNTCHDNIFTVNYNVENNMFVSFSDFCEMNEIDKENAVNIINTEYFYEYVYSGEIYSWSRYFEVGDLYMHYDPVLSVSDVLEYSIIDLFNDPLVLIHLPYTEHNSGRFATLLIPISSFKTVSDVAYQSQDVFTILENELSDIARTELGNKYSFIEIGNISFDETYATATVSFGYQTSDGKNGNGSILFKREFFRDVWELE